MSLEDHIRADVGPEVKVIKGWFQDSLPEYLASLPNPNLPVTFLHVDGDLFVSAAIPIMLLGARMVSGTVIVFDELYQYPEYEKHEMLALYLWAQQFHVTLCALGTHSTLRYPPPLTGSKREAHQDQQSAAFRIVSIDQLASSASGAERES